MVLFICIEGKWKSCTSSAVMLSACEPTPSKLVCLSPACLNCPTTAVDLQRLLPYKKTPFPLDCFTPCYFFPYSDHPPVFSVLQCEVAVPGSKALNGSWLCRVKPAAL